MKLHISILILLNCVFVLFSCGTIKQKTYFYNEIVVRNGTFDSIQDVEIRAEKTHRVFKCSNIAPRASCSNSFPKRVYQNSPIKITWVYQDRGRAKKEFVLQVPDTMKPAVALRGVLEIKQDGSIATYFEQK